MIPAHLSLSELQLNRNIYPPSDYVTEGKAFNDVYIWKKALFCLFMRWQVSNVPQI
jgi:hypothetical protein